MMNVIVTGSSTGIGRALALRLVKKGHLVFGLARSDQSDLAAIEPRFSASACDVAIWSQVQRSREEIPAVWTHADGLVCCAGIHGEVGRALGADPSRWGAAVRVNLDGTYHAIRAFYPLLAKGPNRAKVICFAGGGATKARPNFSAYGTAKTAVIRLVETIALEEAGAALDINAVAPGAISTRLTDEIIALGPKVVGASEYETALKLKAGGGASAEKALDLVEWLLSKQSDGISGRLLSAPWDPWARLPNHRAELAGSEVYTLRRVLPEERGLKFQ